VESRWISQRARISFFNRLWMLGSRDVATSDADWQFDTFKLAILALTPVRPEVIN
jgi:hypothetical protein